MSTLERAILLATTAHAGAVDKAGQPYILHPLRVMLAVSSEEERIAAVLHDVVEDTEWTLEDLRREGFSPIVVAAVDALSRRPGEEYLDFVRRAAQNPVARVVKRADVVDNMDLGRLPSPTARDRARLERYAAALAVLDGEGGRDGSAAAAEIAV